MKQKCFLNSVDQIHYVLNSFISSFYNVQAVVLFGIIDSSLYKKISLFPNVEFFGRANTENTFSMREKTIRILRWCWNWMSGKNFNSFSFTGYQLLKNFKFIRFYQGLSYVWWLRTSIHLHMPEHNIISATDAYLWPLVHGELLKSWKRLWCQFIDRFVSF